MTWIASPLAVLSLLCASSLIAAPAPAAALECSGGVSVGGIQVGTEPKLAVSAFVGFLWHREGDFRFEVHNMFSILPGVPVGIYGRNAATLGYGWKEGSLGFGPSLSIYSMMVCGVAICNRVVGVAPGGHAQVDWYLGEHWGASVGANVDWAGGRSRILSDDLIVMVTAGPIWRFGVKSK
jgi:hypothetical protein